VVDPGFRSTVGAHSPPQDQGLARFQLDLGFGQGFADGLGQRGEFEGGRRARLVLAGAHERGLGAVAEHQPERVEQDRLARPGFAGKHAEARRESQVERLDQDDITDRERGQHNAPAGIRDAPRPRNVVPRPTHWHSRFLYSGSPGEEFVNKAVTYSGRRGLKGWSMTVLTIRAHRRYAVRQMVT